VGLGVCEIGLGFNSFFLKMIVEELTKEYCDKKLFGGVHVRIKDFHQLEA
jgi:hypothetical protein